MSTLCPVAPQIAIPPIPIDRLQILAKQAITFYKIKPGQYGISLDELVNEAWLGIQKAAHRFDPSRGKWEKFVSFVGTMAIRDFIQKAQGLLQDQTQDKYTMVRRMIPWTDTGLRFGQDTHADGEDMG